MASPPDASIPPRSREARADAGWLATVGWPMTLALALVAVVTVAAIILTDGNPGAALAPVVAIGFCYLLVNVPVRYPALILIFLGLTMESPGEVLASGAFKSPIYIFGWAMMAHLNMVFTGLKPLAFSGSDLGMLALVLIVAYRRATGSRIDGRGFVETAAPLRFFAWVTIGGGLLMEAWGIARGGCDVGQSLWQVEHVVFLPLVFYVFHYTFRGPRDMIAVAKVILTAAILRAALAWALRTFIHPNDIEAMPVATTHTDSMLFAAGTCLCVTLLLEMPTRRHKLLCVLALPILVAGMQANNRRIVWVEVAFGLATALAVMPMTPLKRKVMRWVLIASPFIIAYLVIGWNQSTGPFRGAAMIRSLVDSKTDASTQWRDNENFDLLVSLKSNPLLGLGFGHRYIGPIDIEDVYPQEHFLPHDALLGIWAFGGLIGFALYWVFLAAGGFVAARCYRFATTGVDRVASLFVLQMLLIYMNHGYGDLGFGTQTGVVLMAVALALIGKVALTTGAWPAKGRAVQGAS